MFPSSSTSPSNNPFVNGIRDIFFNKSTHESTLAKAKQTEDLLAGYRDANDQHFKNHLMQLQYNHIPFDNITQRIQSSRYTLEHLVLFGERLKSIHERDAKLSEGLLSLKLDEKEFPGSLFQVLCGLNRYAQDSRDLEVATASKISSLFLSPMTQYKKAHSYHVNSLLTEFNGIQKTIQAANSKLASSSNALRSALRVEAATRTKCEAFAQKQSDITSAESEKDFKAVHASMEQAISRVKDAEQKRDEQEANVAQVVAKLSGETDRISLDAQFSENNRVDATRICLEQLLRAEIDHLDAKRKMLSDLLDQTQQTESALDARLFVHFSVVEAFLHGQVETMEINDGVAPPENEFEEELRETIFETIDNYLVWVFDNNGDATEAPTSIGEMCTILGHGYARNHLLKALNLYRTSRTHVGRGFDDLVVLIVALLDSCYVNSDIKTGKMTSIMTETFYAYKHELGEEDDDGGQGAESKVYLQDRVRSHALWQTVYFWQEAFLFSVREEVEKNMAKRPIPIKNIVAEARKCELYTPSKSRSSSAPPYLESLSAEQLEGWHTYCQIVSCQIGSYAFNMFSFDLSMKLVRSFVEMMSTANCLSAQERELLLQTVKQQHDLKVEEALGNGKGSNPAAHPPRGEVDDTTEIQQGEQVPS